MIHPKIVKAGKPIYFLYYIVIKSNALSYMEKKKGGEGIDYNN